MFLYFNHDSFRAEPVKVFSLKEAIRDCSREEYEFNIRKYQY
jgi:hypothetical protein